MQQLHSPTGATVSYAAYGRGAPLVLPLGHSDGGQVALGAAAAVRDRVRKLVLYEPPWPSALSTELLAKLEDLARDGRWDEMAATFVHDRPYGAEVSDPISAPFWRNSTRSMPCPSLAFADSAIVAGAI